MKVLLISCLVFITSMAQTGRRLLQGNCVVSEVTMVVEGKKCNDDVTFDDADRLQTPEECAEEYRANLGAAGGEGYISFKNHESDTLVRGCAFSTRGECRNWHRVNTQEDWKIFMFTCDEATTEAPTEPVVTCGYDSMDASKPDGNIITNPDDGLNYWQSVATPEDCQALCDANFNANTNTGCNAGSHNAKNNRCNLYSDATTLESHSNNRRTGFIQTADCTPPTTEEATTPSPVDLMANVGCEIISTSVGACVGASRRNAEYQLAANPTGVDECLAGNGGDNFFVKSSMYQRAGFISLRETGDCDYSDTCSTIESVKTKWTVYEYSCPDCSSVKIGDNMRCPGATKNTAAEGVADTYDECINYWRWIGEVAGFVSFESRNSRTFCAYTSSTDCDNPLSVSGTWATYSFDCNAVMTTDDMTTTDDMMTSLDDETTAGPTPI